MITSRKFFKHFVTKNDYEGTEGLIFLEKKWKKRFFKFPGFDRDPGSDP